MVIASIRSGSGKSRFIRERCFKSPEGFILRKLKFPQKSSLSYTWINGTSCFSSHFPLNEEARMKAAIFELKESDYSVEVLDNKEVLSVVESLANDTTPSYYLYDASKEESEFYYTNIKLAATILARMMEDELGVVLRFKGAFICLVTGKKVTLGSSEYLEMERFLIQSDCFTKVYDDPEKGLAWIDTESGAINFGGFLNPVASEDRSSGFGSLHSRAVSHLSSALVDNLQVVDKFSENEEDRSRFYRNPLSYLLRMSSSDALKILQSLPESELLTNYYIYLINANTRGWNQSYASDIIASSRSEVILRNGSRARVNPLLWQWGFSSVDLVDSWTPFRYAFNSQEGVYLPGTIPSELFQEIQRSEFSQEYVAFWAPKEGDKFDEYDLSPLQSGDVKVDRDRFGKISNIWRTSRLTDRYYALPLILESDEAEGFTRVSFEFSPQNSGEVCVVIWGLNGEGCISKLISVPFDEKAADAFQRMGSLTSVDDREFWKLNTSLTQWLNSIGG